jgi:heterodisulfide reductase subunit B
LIRSRVRQLTGTTYGVPTLSHSELAGLLLGWDPYDVVGIQAHTVPVEPLLDKIGISYDKSKQWPLSGKDRGCLTN